MVIPHNINLGRTLGAVFIGNVVAAVLYGITSLQTYIFFRGNRRDRPLFKFLIFFLWCLDTLHICLMTHGIYHYLITNFNNIGAISRPTWSLLGQVIVTCLSDLIVRSVFARRIWILSGKNKYLLIAIITTSLFVFAFAARGFIDASYSKMVENESWLLYAALGGSVVADVIITASLCTLLSRSRTGVKSSDSLVHILMAYTINTALLTSICATACFVTFAIWSHQFVFMGIYFALSKLYINSLLALLNTRDSLGKRNAGVTTMPRSPSFVDPMVSLQFMVPADQEDNSFTNKPEPVSVTILCIFFPHLIS
ncbi:hypothetical protein BJ165DRAFT_1063025 [Panaeolus papilionaceus]|nr:hypothetical protein BJ165DRAFT_1063025 [Panaeolus papilionaceus]